MCDRRIVMQISWVLLAENVAVNEDSQRMDLIGEFRRVVADRFPYVSPKFYIVCRVKADQPGLESVSYKLTLRRPSLELEELHSSNVSVNIAPNVAHVVGNLIEEIQDFEFRNQGPHTLTAQLGDSVFSTDIMVIPRRDITHDTQE